jgi:hypothetical protein
VVVLKCVLAGVAVVAVGFAALVTGSTGVSHAAGAPASISLVAAPPAVPCNGRNSSIVTATVRDTDGNPVNDGTPVTFSVVAFGVADPIFTTTSGGVVRSTITPLSSSFSSIKITVTSGTAASSIEIDCVAVITATPPSSPTPVPTDTSIPTATATASSTASPTTTATASASTTASPTSTADSSVCLTRGQKISLLIGIIKRLGANGQSRAYQPRFDVNKDGSITLLDAMQVVLAPTCSHGKG